MLDAAFLSSIWLDGPKRGYEFIIEFTDTWRVHGIRLAKWMLPGSVAQGVQGRSKIYIQLENHFPAHL